MTPPTAPTPWQREHAQRIGTAITWVVSLLVIAAFVLWG